MVCKSGINGCIYHTCHFKLPIFGMFGLTLNFELNNDPFFFWALCQPSTINHTDTVWCYSYYIQSIHASIHFQDPANCRPTFANKRSLRTFHAFGPIGCPIDGRLSSTPAFKKWGKGSHCDRVVTSGYAYRPMYFPPSFVFDFFGFPNLTLLVYRLSYPPTPESGWIYLPYP